MDIFVNDADGIKRTLNGSAGDSLMEVIRDQDIEMPGTCGGMASCGTCHIYVDSNWHSVTGESTEDEGYMLEALAEAVEVRASSRLACQITLSEAMHGLSVEVAPQA